MRFLYAFFLFVSVCNLASADDVSDEWQKLSSRYLEYVTAGKYESALDVALELNSMDPADTETLLFIVYASVKSGMRPPQWVLEQPWPNATPRDKFNRQLAEQLADGS